MNALLDGIVNITVLLVILSILLAIIGIFLMSSFIIARRIAPTRFGTQKHRRT